MQNHRSTFAPCSLALDTPSSNFWGHENQTSVKNAIPTPYAPAFVEWIKRQIIAGRPVMVGLRLRYYTDAEYDHLVPFWGVCSNNVSSVAALNSNADGFSLTTDYAVRGTRGLRVRNPMRCQCVDHVRNAAMGARGYAVGALVSDVPLIHAPSGMAFTRCGPR
jgi:hypothetical protein